MILIDTNIISEMMKPSPSDKVINWIDQQLSSELYITSITIAEIAYGLYVLAKGKRRQLLEEAFDGAIIKAFKRRVLPFDESAAHIYANIMGRRKELGCPMSISDGQIASIALSCSLKLATRNIKDFQQCGLKLINPFK